MTASNLNTFYNSYRLPTTVTTTIGTAPGRDYSTITAWEADLDNEAIYIAGDDAVGECYNDSTFDEYVNINGGGTVGLNSITLTAASSDRHDGTSGSGVNINLTTSSTSDVLALNTIPTTIEWIEILNKTGRNYGIDMGDQDGHQVHHCIIHDFQHSTYYQAIAGILTQPKSANIHIVINNIVYNINNTATTGSGYINSYGITHSNGYVTLDNNTVFNITTGSTSNVANGIKADNDVGVSLYNNIAVNASTSDFDTVGSSANADYNLSSDSTAPGANSLTNKSASAQFVSTVSGSEDLHLKSGADAIGAGTDLGTTPQDVNIDINGSNRDAFVATTWDIGAHQYELTASIGTAVGRDYNTITAWEADLDNPNIYGAGARARGECYNDSVFSDTDLITIDGGNTVGLAHRTLSVAQSERHNGTAGTGARIVASSNGNRLILGTTECRVEWLEIDYNDHDTQSRRGLVYQERLSNTLYTTVVANMLIHNVIATKAAKLCEGSPDRQSTWINNIVYNLQGGETTGEGLAGCYSKDDLFVVNNVTVFNINRTDSYSTGEGAAGIHSASTSNVQNCIAVDVFHDLSTLTPQCFNNSGTNIHHNLSSDATASGAGSLTNKSSANQFVSIVSGSEDLHLKSGADAIDAGVDLGTTPEGVNIDINGYDRDAAGVVWDMGAHEYVVVGTPVTVDRIFNVSYLADINPTRTFNVGNLQDLSLSREKNVGWTADVGAVTKTYDIEHNLDVQSDRIYNIEYLADLSATDIFNVSWLGGTSSVTADRTFDIEYTNDVRATKTINIAHALDVGPAFSFDVEHSLNISSAKIFNLDYTEGVATSFLFDIENLAGASFSAIFDVSWSGSAVFSVVREFCIENLSQLSKNLQFPYSFLNDITVDNTANIDYLQSISSTYNIPIEHIALLSVLNSYIVEYGGQLDVSKTIDIEHLLGIYLVKQAVLSYLLDISSQHIINTSWIGNLTSTKTYPIEYISSLGTSKVYNLDWLADVSNSYIQVISYAGQISSKGVFSIDWGGQPLVPTYTWDLPNKPDSWSFTQNYTWKL